MKQIILLTFLAHLVSCGDSGSWISFPMADCHDGKPNFSMVEGMDMTEEFEDMAKGLCAQSGQAFSGTFKCEGNDVLAKCK